MTSLWIAMSSHNLVHWQRASLSQKAYFNRLAISADNFTIEIVTIRGSLLKKQVSNVHIHKCAVWLCMLVKHLHIDKKGFVLTVGRVLVLYNTIIHLTVRMKPLLSMCKSLACIQSNTTSLYMYTSLTCFRSKLPLIATISSQ